VNYNASAAAAKDVVAELDAMGRRAEAVRADVAREDQVARHGRARAGALRATRCVGEQRRRDDARPIPRRAGRGLRRDVRHQRDRHSPLYPAGVAPDGRRALRAHHQPFLQLARASVGTGGFAAYAATKGAIEAFTRAMAHEVGPTASPSTPSRPAGSTPT